MQKVLASFRTLSRPKAMCILAAVTLTLLAIEAYAVMSWQEGAAPLPPLFGNFERIRATLTSAPEKEEFTFAVAGDTRGANGIFERISAESRKTPTDFTVLLGDFAGATEAEHRFLRAEISEKFLPTSPVFCLAGNHDIDPRAFPIKRFEELYGPSIFSFEYQGCLFIGLRVIGDQESNQASLDFLISLLNKGTEKYRKVFVFMHIPPPVPAFDTRKFRAPEEFISLFQQLKVDYVFAGHYHGYARSTYGTTVYLVTGGGGATLDRTKARQFHHALLVRVGRDYVTEQIVPGPSSYELADGLEGTAVTRVYPWLSRHRVGAGILSTVLAGTLLGMAAAVARRKSKRAVAVD